jgi:crossover junction endodeoxyribonuclease RuvC
VRRAEAGPIRVLGVDPGSLSTGFGLVEECGGRLRLLTAGAITAAPGAPLADRLVRIFARLEEVLEEGRPDELAVEGLFHAKNAKSALLLGHARGVALLAAARRGLKVHEYAPQQVKKALVGTGRAEKHQVQSMVRLLLAAPAPLHPQDAADAVAVAVCHLHSRRLRRLGAERSRAAGRAAAHP